MNKVIWIAVAILFMAMGNVQAHCGKCGVGDSPKAMKQELGDPQSDKMAKELKLSDEQKTQVSAIMKEKREKQRQIMEQKQASMDALQAEVRAKLKGVLSEEQMKKWEEIKEKCPMCKDGKPCEKCKMKKGKCPDCKDGKKCPKCALKKEKGKMDHGHDH